MVGLLAWMTLSEVLFIFPMVSQLVQIVFEFQAMNPICSFLL